MANILIYLLVAAGIGWVATELMHDRSNLLLNIIVALVGATDGNRAALMFIMG